MKKLRFLLVSSTALSLVFTLGLEAKSKREVLEKNLTIDLSQPVSLEFIDVDGDLKFSSWEKSLVNIRVTKEAKALDSRRSEKLLRETEVEISQRKNEIKVEIHYPRLKGLFFWLTDLSRVKVKTEIILPRRSEVRGRTVDGSIQGENIKGKAFLRTVDGSIYLRNLQADIRARTTDGRIRIEDINGEVEARTIDGDVNISGVLTELNLSSVDGDIFVNAQPSSQMKKDWNISSVDGDIEFYLPPDFSADFYFRTSDGRITSRIPLVFTEFSSRKKISGKINEGGYVLRIKTVDGDILVNTSSGQ
ncbi:MAG: DUF4097 domain-containing protein [Candidatus Aminicenantales bacterium]